MANEKWTEFTENTDPQLTDITAIVDNPGGSPLNQKVTLANLKTLFLDLVGDSISAGGRLTMVSGTPVTTADIYSGTSLWYVPYQSNILPLWDGTKWVATEFDATNVSLAGTSGTLPHDIFAYLSGGVATFEHLKWSSTTARATDISRQDGKLCKVGDHTRLYIGTIYCSSGGQTDDSVTKRFVWNYYNRMTRNMLKSDSTQHNYTTGAWRAWNNDTTIRVEFVKGVQETPDTCSLLGQMETSYASIGYDVTNNELGSGEITQYNQNTSFRRHGAMAYYNSGIGYHYYQAVEYGESGATQGAVFVLIGVLG